MCTADRIPIAACISHLITVTQRAARTPTTAGSKAQLSMLQQHQHAAERSLKSKHGPTSTLTAQCNASGDLIGVNFAFHGEDLTEEPTQLRFHMSPAPGTEPVPVASWKWDLPATQVCVCVQSLVVAFDCRLGKTLFTA